MCDSMARDIYYLPVGVYAMKWLDIVLLVLIVGYCAYVIFVKKKKGCGGNCSDCAGCFRQEKKDI